MKTAVIRHFYTPQWFRVHAGKVRDSFQLTPERRVIVTTDRISAFDHILDCAIPGKGAVLTQISRYWFDKTQSIIGNHFISSPHAQVMIVQEATPIRLEIIVRGFLAGSMWRAYEKGQRQFGEETLPDGLTQNARLPQPILTPTTKDKMDRPITRAEILREGLATAKQYQEMCEAAVALYTFGRDHLAPHKLILADAKYEFGMHHEDLILIDELHTPDCARIWDAESYAREPQAPFEWDKEFVRRWLRENPVVDEDQTPTLPDSVIEETSQRYMRLLNMLTGQTIDPAELGAPALVHALVTQQLLAPGYVAIFMGSRADVEHAERIAVPLRRAGVFVDMRVVSAHKNGAMVEQFAIEYNGAAESGVAIAVAGLSNGLGGALAASLNIPVINCPPFKDQVDMLTNIQSSLMMPSGVPALTIIGSNAAAEAALRCLNLYGLRQAFTAEREKRHAKLASDDIAVRLQARQHDRAGQGQEFVQ